MAENAIILQRQPYIILLSFVVYVDHGRTQINKRIVI